MLKWIRETWCGLSGGHIYTPKIPKHGYAIGFAHCERCAKVSPWMKRLLKDKARLDRVSGMSNAARGVDE